MRPCPRCDLVLDQGATRCLRCGARIPPEDQSSDEAARIPPTQPPAPMLVDGRYAVESVLGRGSMGVVYLARDTNLERKVALKVIAPELIHQPDIVERFRREAAAQASVRNEHVVQVYAFGPHEQSCFFAMEYVRGRSLEEIIFEHNDHRSHVPTLRALSILHSVAEGLAAAHDVGLVHRDVKPGNVLIEDRTGRPVLLDFGLVRSPDPDRRGTAVVGSPPYMAPEQILSTDAASLTPRTDIYGLGCTAFELLTGHPPFEDGSVYAIMDRHVRAPVPRLSSRRPDLAMLDELLERALAKRPEDRFDDCRAIADALEKTAARWRTAHPETHDEVGLPAPVRNPRTLRVLVVDDDPTFARYAVRATELAFPGAGVRSSIAHSGLEALTQALEDPPDLIVLDYDMPALSGVDTLSHLRDQPRCAKSRVLVVSGNLGSIERWRFSVLGVRDFLAKPVTLRDLVAAIGRVARN